MTIQEEINHVIQEEINHHVKEVADEKYKEGFLCYANSGDAENDKKNDECVKYAKEHEQFAEWLEELKQYRAIGTVEEYREAMEKQKAKKYERGLDKDVRCPVCGTYTTDIFEHRFCTYCGQRLE